MTQNELKEILHYEPLTGDFTWLKENKIRNNKWSNFRDVSHGINQSNKSNLNNNTSGYTGVSFDKTCKKWRAFISVNKKRISLGYFDNPDDAIKARKDAEIKYNRINTFK